jgi:hypothetical protein
MKKTSIDFLRSEVERLRKELAELKMQRQQAKLNDGLPISEDEKAEFARSKQDWEISQIERMQQLATEHPEMRPRTLRADFGEVKNPERIEHKNREQQ